MKRSITRHKPRYSFTAPQVKYLFGLDTKLWFVFVGAVLTVFFAIWLLMDIRVASFSSRIGTYQEERTKMEEEIRKIDERIRFVRAQEELAAEIRGRNQVVSDSLANLFALIPDSIYLTEAVVSEKELLLKGYTPSKQIFNLLLAPPLKSIFSETKTWFYPMDNGWFRFVTENRSDEEDVLYGQKEK